MAVPVMMLDRSALAQRFDSNHVRFKIQSKATGGTPIHLMPFTATTPTQRPPALQDGFASLGCSAAMPNPKSSRCFFAWAGHDRETPMIAMSKTTSGRLEMALVNRSARQPRRRAADARDRLGRGGGRERRCERVGAGAGRVGVCALRPDPGRKSPRASRRQMKRYAPIFENKPLA